ncbi:MAG: amidase [Calditrichia bacterium]
MTKREVALSIFFLMVLTATFVYSELKDEPIKASDVKSAQSMLDLSFTDVEIDSMIEGLQENRRNYRDIRGVELSNSVMPTVQFHPLPTGFKFERGASTFSLKPNLQMKRPKDLDELAFASIRDLAGLIKQRKVSSVELTTLYLDRLKKHGPTLECVISLMEERAMEQARLVDKELAAGTYRGLLHGIPYGAKDLLAAKGAKTTWGAEAYKDQTIDMDATVIRKLEDAGAVLVAKLTLGALAWGDVWFGGKTRNPWNLEQGSSGSSAGSASATSAGLVPFAIGSETWGSIVSPATRCGISGLRPTYGRVSRHGAMALSWSMDKLGPLARSVEDCAIVFNAIYGQDEADPTLYNAPFSYGKKVDIKKLRIGYLKAAFDADSAGKAYNDAALKTLSGLGGKLIPVELPDYPTWDIGFVLSAEAAAAFDLLTRSNRDDLLVRQIKNAWPNVFRASRFIPAVEYINANRVRGLIIKEMAEVMSEVDVYIAPSFGENLLLTNLTGHPCVVLQNGFDDKGNPVSISLTGRLFDEETLLQVAQALQEANTHHTKHPVL